MPGAWRPAPALRRIIILPTPALLLRQPGLCQLPGDLCLLVRRRELLRLGRQAPADGSRVGESRPRTRHSGLPVGRPRARLYAGEFLNKQSTAWATPARWAATRRRQPYGALDMAGNVWEWVNDWYEHQLLQHSPYANPRDRCRPYKVLRGGSWGSCDYYSVCRSQLLYLYDPAIIPVLGFSLCGFHPLIGTHRKLSF